MIMYYMKKCKITIDKIIFEVVLFNSPTANKIWKSLPISSNIKTWGKEIYFYTDVVANKEPDAKSIIEFGEIAYWPIGKAIAIGFGKTPISQKDEISFQNFICCLNFLNQIKFDVNEIHKLCDDLPEIALRFEKKAGIQNSVLINDSYYLLL